MKQVETPNGYLAIETICGIDVYMDDVYVCELSSKTFANFSYDEKINLDKLEEAIEDEIDTLNVMERIREC